MPQTPAITSRVFEWNTNATSLSVTPSQGVYFIQYFRIDLNEQIVGLTSSSAAPTNSPTTSQSVTAGQSTASTTQYVETTTKLGLTASIAVSTMITLLHNILFA